MEQRESDLPPSLSPSPAPPLATSPASAPAADGDAAAEAAAVQSKKLNESVYELYSPSRSDPNLDIVFFHGLQLRDYYSAYTEAWVTAKGDECWPQTWLAHDFPRARILSVSYDSSSIRGAKQGNMDMEAIGEILVSALIRQAGVGQTNPVILVGHSLGGLVIKQICLKAESIFNSRPSETYLQTFLSNLRGTFFYATPHHGSRLANMAAYLPWYPSMLLKYLTVLNEETESLNDSFCKIRKKYHWKAFGVGEARQVFVPGLGRGLIVVPEESARHDMDYFAQLAEDHITICKPMGKTCSSYRHFIAFVLSIVGKVHRCHGVPFHAAGLHSQVEDVIQLLEGSALVAIVGKEGIGLTSIAMAVFNTLSYDFEYTCFVDNVKGCCPRYEKLEARILGSLYQRGRKLKNCDGDWSILKGKKVLLVMDGVDSRDQVRLVLEAGGFTLSGPSRVIITSRGLENLRLLLPEFSIFSGRSLNDEAAKKVLCHQAFKEPKVPAQLGNFKGLVKEVVKSCEGLPLVLELIGRSLYRPTWEEYREDVWKDCISRLQAAESESMEGKGGLSDSTCKLLRKLRICYDGLGPQEQSMFLDVATVFHGWPVSRLLAAWSTCGCNNGAAGWSNLLARGLVKRVDLSHLRGKGEKVAYTHSALRDLARSIISESGSRVYDYRQEDQVLKLLRNENEKENLQLKALVLRRWKKAWCPDLNLSRLARMSELKYVILKNVPVSGRPDSLPTGLSLLHWRLVPGRNNSLSSSTSKLNGLSHLTKLAVLDIDARGHRGEGALDTMAESLATLVGLRVLKFQGDFVQLPDNFGNLKHLQLCTLSSGLRLTRLPDSFGSLSSLQELVISSAGLVTLPHSFGHLHSLNRLRLECFHLKELPESFGELFSLQFLHLFCCEDIKNLPESFGNLSALQFLELNVCPSFEGLPDSFDQLGALKKLRISYCGRLDWPSTFGSNPLPALAKLEISGFERLPESLGQLSSLRRLKLSDVDAKLLPESFGQLESLQFLLIQKCPFVAAWHLELYRKGWIGFYQRMTQDTERSMLEVLVYFRSSEYEEMEPENLEQKANRIISQHFPHPPRWEWPEAVAVGPVLRRPESDVQLSYQRHMSRILRG